MPSDLLFVCYPKCSTCKKAQKFLDEHNISYEIRDIKEDNPSADEIKKWHKLSDKPLNSFFNTSGKIYRVHNIKDKLPSMSEEEQYELLASDGMLVKRPILVSKSGVLVGFKEQEYQDLI